MSIILYEMAFKSIPLFYTRWIGADILDMWRSTNDFSIFPLYRKRKGIPGIEEIISLISIRGIQMNPKQRISLLTYHRLISHLQEFYGSLKGWGVGAEDFSLIYINIRFAILWWS